MGRRHRKKNGVNDLIAVILVLTMVSYFWQPVVAIITLVVVIWVIVTIVKYLDKVSQKHSWAQPPPPVPQPPIKPAFPVAVPVARRVETMEPNLCRCERCKEWLPLSARFCRRCGMAQVDLAQSSTKSPAGRVAV